MVLDRLFLWIFTLAVLVGTCGIILHAPTLYDTREAVDTKLSQVAFAFDVLNAKSRTNTYGKTPKVWEEEEEKNSNELKKKKKSFACEYFHTIRLIIFCDINVNIFPINVEYSFTQSTVCDVYEKKSASAQKYVSSQKAAAQKKGTKLLVDVTLIHKNHPWCENKVLLRPINESSHCPNSLL